jgi:hypothetical protein
LRNIVDEESKESRWWYWLADGCSTWVLLFY